MNKARPKMIKNANPNFKVFTENAQVKTQKGKPQTS
jgi:hypothetical protein